MSHCKLINMRQKATVVQQLALKALVSSRGIFRLFLFTTFSVVGGGGGGDALDPPPMSFSLSCLPPALSACRLKSDPMEPRWRRETGLGDEGKMLLGELFCWSFWADIAAFTILSVDSTSSGSNCSFLRVFQEQGVAGGLGDERAYCAAKSSYMYAGFGDPMMASVWRECAV